MTTLLDSGYKTNAQSPGWGFKMLDESEKDGDHPVCEGRRLDDMASFTMTFYEADDEFAVAIRLENDSFDDEADSQTLRELFARVQRECRRLSPNGPTASALAVAHMALVTNGENL